MESSSVNVRELPPIYRVITWYTGWVVGFSGLLITILWLAFPEFMFQVLPAWAAIRLPSALCFVLMGWSLCFWERKNARHPAWLWGLPSLMIVMAGTIALYNYLTGGQDEFSRIAIRIFHPGFSHYPGMISLLSAIGFTLLGTSIFLIYLNRRTFMWLIQGSTIISLAISLTVTSGYIYSQTDVLMIGPYPSMCFLSAIFFLAMSVAVLILTSGEGLLEVMYGPRIGSRMVRQRIIIFLILPFLIGFVVLEGQRKGLFGAEAGNAILATCTSLVSCFILINAARGLNRAEDTILTGNEKIRQNEAKLETLFKVLPVGVAFLNPKGEIVKMNDEFASVVAMSKDKLLEEQYRFRSYMRPDGSLITSQEWPSALAIRERRVVQGVEIGVQMEHDRVRWMSTSAAPVDIAGLSAIIVVTDITAQKETEIALKNSQTGLREALDKVTEVEEEIRRRAAIELHDQVGQNLTALIINMNFLKSQLRPGTDTKLGKILDDSLELLSETIAKTRDIMTELRPSVLEDYGLFAALQWYAGVLTQRTGMRVLIRGKDMEQNLSKRLEYAIFRVAQEALTNITKHAEATEVIITLSEVEQEIVFSISDNGKGFRQHPGEKTEPMYGITGMTERALSVGGSLEIESGEAGGTTVLLRIKR